MASDLRVIKGSKANSSRSGMEVEFSWVIIRFRSILRTVLGVGPNASLDEIQDAYRAKSKKHHPDVGGDEWAFRMVVRAYEVLKTTVDAPAACRPWESPGTDVAPQGQSPGWTWGGSAPFVGASAATATPWSDFGESSETSEDDQTGATPAEPEQPIADPTELRTVEVELIWTRFELELKKTDRDHCCLPRRRMMSRSAFAWWCRGRHKIWSTARPRSLPLARPCAL